jgi:hypothetical protein
LDASITIAPFGDALVEQSKLVSPKAKACRGAGGALGGVVFGGVAGLGDVAAFEVFV